MADFNKKAGCGLGCTQAAAGFKVITFGFLFPLFINLVQRYQFGNNQADVAQFLGKGKEGFRLRFICLFFPPGLGPAVGPDYPFDIRFYFSSVGI
ncbi:MAG: hypothetical protein ACO1O1_13100 [Adhaeribacter sp.]